MSSHQNRTFLGNKILVLQNRCSTNFQNNVHFKSLCPAEFAKRYLARVCQRSFHFFSSSPVTGLLCMDDFVLIRGPERDENCSLFINRDVIDRLNSCAKHLPIISHEALQCDSPLYKPAKNKSTYKNESPKYSF